MKNYKNVLFINYGGIGDEISARIKALNSANELEKETNFYGVAEEFDEDRYENEGFTMEEEEFEVSMEDESNE